MSKEITRQPDSAFEVLKAAATPTARLEAGEYAIAEVPLVGGVGVVPRMFYDLPWADDDDQVVSQILAQLAASEDIDQATKTKELRKADDVVDLPMVVLGLAVRASDVDDAKWGAYLSLTCSIENEAPEVINTGAAQICVTMWRRWCEGRFPVSGRIVKLGAPKKGRNQPLGFAVEEKF